MHGRKQFSEWFLYITIKLRQSNQVYCEIFEAHFEKLEKGSI